jgi:hypothetical protein
VTESRRTEFFRRAEAELVRATGSRDDDEAEQHELQVPAWVSPPDGILGAAAAITGLIGRTDHLVCALTDLVAYPTGLTFGIRFVLRRGDWSGEDWDRAEDAFWGQERAHFRRRRSMENHDVWQLGVEYADGRAALVDYYPGWGGEADPPEPAAPVLRWHGGGGGGGSSRQLDTAQSFWLWPLPAVDWFDIVVAWPALHLDESRFRIDMSSVRDAASRAIPLWE